MVAVCIYEWLYEHLYCLDGNINFHSNDVFKTVVHLLQVLALDPYDL